jgi:hypothetical protein
MAYSMLSARPRRTARATLLGLGLTSIVLIILYIIIASNNEKAVRVKEFAGRVVKDVPRWRSDVC